ncbi:MAG: hypothetical protein KF725_01810 [Cyclobacteriaceae bacterium]|nr:hypothetical protein [Cyclobacteriaceae bacterium]UYN86817.1 MAG: hypothetical protein KIT51_00595 [Cyclobacteriaceae bacterium]
MRPIFITFFLLFCLSGVAQNKQYTFVFLNTRTDKTELPKEEVDKLMEGHLANITRLAKEGKLIVAGPFDGGGGIFILNTTSIDEANAWLSTDPGIQANRWKLDVLPYQPRIGGVCAAKEPYEMVTYNFIRFRSNIHKETVGDYPMLLKKHDEYLKQLAKNGNVITEGIFDDQEGGILIMKGDIQAEVFENDPAVKGGTLLFEVKKLWVAKGAFCEQ